MPLLFNLAIHNALVEVKREMRVGEELFAFLDDVYILSSLARTRFLYHLVGEKLLSMSWIQLHTGKTRCWNRMGQPPPDMEVLGPEVWSPEGSRFSERRWAQRNSSRRRPEAPGRTQVVCAWQVLLQCSGPRCHHTPRTMLLAVLRRSRRRYVKSHGHRVGWPSGNRKTAPGCEDVGNSANAVGRVGFGLRSAQRMAHAAYRASWADALPKISERLPAVATSIVTALENQDARGCLGELSESARRLDREGFVSRPDWRALSRGARPPDVSNAEPGECSTVGSIMRLPVPNTSFGRPWCCQLHVPPTKRICDPTLAPVRATFSSVLPRSLSSSCSLSSSVPSCSSGCFGRVRKTQGCMPVRKAPFASRTSRKNVCTHLQGSRGDGTVQRQVA